MHARWRIQVQLLNVQLETQRLSQAEHKRASAEYAGGLPQEG